jgi:hypothetical protein
MAVSGESTLNGELERVTVPVAGEPQALEPRRRLLLALPLPRGPVAVAAGGLTVGAAVVAIVRAVRQRRLAKIGRRRRKEIQRSVLATRSFLVDVHLLGR